MRLLCCAFLLLANGLSADVIELMGDRDLAGWVPVLAPGQGDPRSMFTVSKSGQLHLAGAGKAYLRTKEDFTDYKLSLEWRWPETPGNSGVFIHAQGEDRIWPLCVQVQLRHRRAGDVILTGVGSGATRDAHTFLVSNPDHPYFAMKRMKAPSEHPVGEWNQLEIVARDRTLEIRVNGVVQNSAKALTLTAGAIGLQVADHPIEFRRIRLEPLKRAAD